MAVTKSILSVSTVAFALMFGGGVYVLTHMDSLAKPAAERVISRALGVDVTIEAMDVSVHDRRASVRNIQVANPQGFEEAVLLSVGTMSIELLTMSEGRLDFGHVEAKDVTIIKSMNDQQISNLEVLSKTLKVDAADQDSVRISVRHFEVPAGHLKLRMDEDESVLPAVSIDEVGSISSRVTAEKGAAIIMGKVIGAAMDAGEGNDIPSVIDAAEHPESETIEQFHNTDF